MADPRQDRDDASVSDTSVSSDSSCSASRDEMVERPTVKSIPELNANAHEFCPKSNNKENAQPINNAKKKKLTLTVEDVPFDEDEELRELHSVWRNRTPSPGEWMEPVDSFQQ